MIDIKKIREALSRGEVISRVTVQNLCDKLDRVIGLHGEAHNARVVAENAVALHWEEVKQLKKRCKKQEKYVVCLLDALVTRGEKP